MLTALVMVYNYYLLFFCFSFVSLVLFRDDQGSMTEITFTVNNQDQPLCADVIADDNSVLENDRLYTVALSSTDRAVVQTTSSNLLVTDDDCKYGTSL